MYIPYDAFVLSALISSIIGFFLNLYRLKTSKTEKGIIVILLLITVVYLFWNSYCYYYTRTDRIEMEEKTARLISGKVQKKWKKHAIPITCKKKLMDITKTRTSIMNKNNFDHVFFYDPTRYEYRENVIELLGNVMDILDDMFPEKKGKFIVGQRGFDSVQRLQKREYRPTFLQNDLISGFLVDGGLVYNSGILFPPNFCFDQLNDYQFFCLVNTNHTPFLDFLKNDYKIKRNNDDNKENEQDKKEEDDFLLKSSIKSTRNTRNTRNKKKIAIEDLVFENIEKIETIENIENKENKENVIELTFMYGHPNFSNLNKSLIQRFVEKCKSSQQNVQIKMHVIPGLQVQNQNQNQNIEFFPVFPKMTMASFENTTSAFENTKIKIKILAYSEELYHLDSVFQDMNIFESMIHDLKEKKQDSLKNRKNVKSFFIDKNEINKKYDTGSLIDLFNNFSFKENSSDINIILVTSPFCPILKHSLKFSPQTRSSIFTFF